MNSTRIASILRNNGWMLNLVFVALSSYFVANAANAVVARAIRITPSIDDAPPPVVLPPTPTGHQALAAIADRNLMGLKREQLDPSAPDPNAPPPPPPFDQEHWNEDQLQSCTLGSTLRATLVADEPRWSMAVLVNNQTHDPAVFSINNGSNAIADDATLMAIRSREIVVRRRDHFERCLGEGDTANPNPPPMASIAPPNTDEPPPPTPGDMTGVTKLSATEYKVERTEVDRVLANLNEVATQARIVPSFKNGKANGFKLFSIKPGSIYSKIGLENGDIIQKINGYDMNSPDRALEIYTKLRDATSLTIDIQRRGSNTTMNYAIN